MSKKKKNNAKPIYVLFERGLKSGAKKNVELTRKVRRALKAGSEVNVYSVNDESADAFIEAFCERQFDKTLPIARGAIDAANVRFWTK
jgi:glycerophosphoryl diester phosphodiesterase